MPDTEVAPAEAPEAEAPAAPEAETQPSDPFDSGQTTFDRAYVEKLRKENASYRTKAKEYEEKVRSFSAFEGLNPDDVSVLADFAGAVVSEPERAAEMAKAWAEQLTPAEQRALATEIGKDSSNALTRDDVLSLIKEERAKAQEEAEVAAATRELESEARGLGYEPGSRDYYLLCLEAHNNQKGDLKKAAAVIEADRQKIIDEYLASKAGDASSTGAPSPDGSAPGHLQQAPRTLEEARQAAKARIAQAFDHANE